jgi:hypothetical protein
MIACGLENILSGDSDGKISFFQICQLINGTPSGIPLGIRTRNAGLFGGIAWDEIALDRCIEVKFPALFDVLPPPSAPERAYFC